MRIIVDGSRPLSEEDRAAVEAAGLAPRVIVLRNKSDLPRQLDWTPDLGPVLDISAREGTGLDALESAVAALFPVGEVPTGELLTNARQTDAVSRALKAVQGAKWALLDGLTPDAVLSDAERAMNALGEITGSTMREDLTARIFERFCVGK